MSKPFAIVTGASAGIGLELAALCGEEGFDLLVAVDRHAAAEKASASIVEVITMQQPPADPLISITPGIRKLVQTRRNSLWNENCPASRNSLAAPAYVLPWRERV